MLPKLPISAFIIAVNEADRIARTIESVRDWVAEVIVIDSGSSDGTPQIAAQAGARVIPHDWPGYGLQKRFGEDQCVHRWVLNVDADEVVPVALREEIMQLFARGEPSADGYRIKIVEILPYDDKPRFMAHSITAIRLYNKEAGRFSDSLVHDTVRMPEQARVETLRAILEHRSSRGIAHSIDKLNRYSTMQAADMEIRGKRLLRPWLRLVFEFPVAFVKAYIFRGYIFHGMYGFINAMIYAFSRFSRTAKHLEHRLKK